MTNDADTAVETVDAPAGHHPAPTDVWPSSVWPSSVWAVALTPVSVPVPRVEVLRPTGNAPDSPTADTPPLDCQPVVLLDAAPPAPERPLLSNTGWTPGTVDPLTALVAHAPLVDPVQAARVWANQSEGNGSDVLPGRRHRRGLGSFLNRG